MASAFLDTDDRLRHERVASTDALAPARGLVIGLLLSALLWALIALLATYLW